MLARSLSLSLSTSESAEMEAVTRSSTRILVNNFNGKSLPLSRAPLGKSQINFFRSSILLSIPLKKTVQCVPLSKTEVSTTADAGIQTMQASKTVHVKFQLQKERLFGEHFFLAGDDPILSCWDASDAVPLNWSNGHLWTAELDAPVERSIQFKYVLGGSKGEIFWQPGLDRFFQTWETNNTITITEDWENAEAQKITEQQMTDPNEELEDVMSADDIAFPEDQQTVNRIEFFVTENETHQKQGPWVNAKAINRNQWKTTMTEKKPTSVEPEESVFTYEGGHVLVPGLNPMPAMSANKAPHREIGISNGDASAKVDASKDQHMPEFTC